MPLARRAAAASMHRGGEARFEEALAVARRCADPEGLARVLEMRGITLLGMPRIEESERVAEELFGLGESLDVFAGVVAYRTPVLAALVRGRRGLFDEALARYRAWADQVRVSYALDHVTFWGGMLALAEGRFEEAKQAVAALAALPLGSPRRLTFEAVILAARLEQGRHASVAARLQGFVTGSSLDWLQVYRAVLAASYAELERADAARREIALLCADDFALLPLRFELPLALRHLAEACALLGDAEHAAALEPLLRPYAGLMLVPFMGTSVEAAADRALGQLAAARGQLDEALGRYRSALALETGFGAPALAARTRYWWARALSERRAAGDLEEARALAREAGADAQRFGMAQLAARTRALAAELG
jgi:tetratricopeptide (TPR) repeat protein